MKAIGSNSDANLYKTPVCFKLMWLPTITIPSNHKPFCSPIKYPDTLSKPICRGFKWFDQGYKYFCLTVIPTCSVPVAMS